MACTYRMKDAAGAWQTISGKPAMMAALAEGRLDHLLPAGTVAAMTAPAAAEQNAAPAPRPAPAAAPNTIFTEDAAAKARELLRRKLAQLNSGLDPEMLQAGITLAGYHIEKGARSFAAYAEAMLADLGGAVRPYLKSWYMGVKYDPRAAGFDGMDSAATVEAADLNEIGTTEQQGAKNGNGSDIARMGEEASAGDKAQRGSAEPATAGQDARDVGAPSPEDDAASSPSGGRNRSGRSAAGGNVGRRGSVRKGGDAADRREGDGGTGMADAGAGNGNGNGRGNYHIADPEQLIGGTPKVRFNRNKAAIEAFQAITAEGRQPTQQELDAMAGYIGWGSFGQELFQGTYDKPAHKDGWATESDWLREHLGREGWESAQRSIINAHYTDPITVSTMWDMVRRLGFTGGRVLEPSMGVGNFFGLMPRDLMAKSRLAGIEMETTTGGMAQMLYPEANIQIKPYQDSRTADNFYDLVIGNWPFAKDGPADRRYMRLSPSLHDFFFLKALDQTRPGGLVVGITSAGTMDKKGTLTRAALAEKADLVAAFRLPSGAFEKYAGTSVVTDIIILKKRDEPNADLSNSGWLRTVEVDTPSGQKVTVNEYYAQRPQNILGTLNFGSGSTWGRPSMIVDRPADLEARMSKLAESLPERVFAPYSAKAKTIQYVTNNTKDRELSVIEQGGKLFQVQGEYLAPLEEVVSYKLKDAKHTAEREKQIRDLSIMRRLYGALIDAERDGRDDTEAKRADLKAAYTAFVAENGLVSDSDGLKILKRANDPFYPTLASLETPNGQPSAILSRPTVRARRRLEKPSIRDALVLARNESVDIDLTRVADLAGVTQEQAAKELVDLGAIFRTPEGGYEVADVYLSGNVRRKLREVEAAAAEGEDMARNIEALKAVLPKDIPYFNIEAKLGATWVRPEQYQQFIAHLLGMNSPDGIEVRWAVNRWKVNFTDRSLNGKPEATTTWGHAGVKFDRLLTAAMGNVAVKVQYRDDDGNLQTDEKATAEANEKASKLREEFGAWLWSDPVRKIEMERTFNEVMNAIALPKFDGSFLTFEGMALQRGDSPFSMREHQVNAVWRGLANGRSLNAHEVGTGKTYTMGALAVESRRYGMAKKPIIFAHNANSASVAREIGEQYPGAKILYIDNLNPERIGVTLRQIANDEWDAIVVPHSLIDRFTLKRESLMEISREQIEALEQEAIEAAQEDGASLSVEEMDDEDAMKKVRSATAKQLVHARNAILKKIEEMAIRSSKEDAISFEDMGIDMVIVDEAHEFKKPPLATRMRMKGLNTGTSNQSISLMFLTDYVKRLNAGRGVHLFTGTPITNTMTEIYNMMRYVMDDQMARDGIREWDAWFNTFADSTSDVELTAAGEYEPVTRLAAFVNVSELRRMIGQYMDIVFADDMPEFKPRASSQGRTLGDKALTDAERLELLNGRTENPIGRPYKKVVADVAEMTPDQQRILARLQEYANRFKNASKKERREIMLAGGPESPVLVETGASNAGLDARLYDMSASDEPANKVNRAVRRIIEHYNEHPQATQVVFVERGFSDTSVSRKKDRETGQVIVTKKDRFNLVADMVGKLVSQGVKREEIAIVDGSTSKDKRKAIADAMNRAEVRVVIGNTKTLGVGVNMQANLRAMHHLDAPWMPGDLEQRNGRGHRQGNKWNTVMEYRYLTERIDGRRWQVLAVKDRFIKAFLKAKDDVRVIEGDAVSMDEEGDIGATLADAAGDPRLLMMNKLKADVLKLENKERMHAQGVADATEKIRQIKRDNENGSRALAGYRKDDAAFRAAVKGDFSARIDGKTYTDIEAANAALAKVAAKKLTEASRETHDLGTVWGFTIQAYWPSRLSDVQYTISSETADYAMGKGTIESARQTLYGIKGRAERMAGQIDDAKASLPRMEEASKSPFARAADLEKKRKMLADLEVDIQRNPIPAPAWLRSGAPTNTEIYVGGNAYVVEGHRWTSNGYFVTVSVKDGTRDVPYMEVTDENGLPVYEEKPFAPPTVAKSASNSSAPSVKRSMSAAATAGGVTAESLPGIFAERFPKLSGAVEEMLARGTLGKKGGLVVLDTNDEVEIAREYAERAGHSFDETVQLFESGDGQFINAFYDPTSGLTFLIGPNLTRESAPALVMHEAVHGQQRERVNAKALALIDGRAGAATPALRAFLDRVAERMDLVGEAGNAAESASYIVELAVKEGRSGSGFSAADGPMLAWIERNIGKPVADIVRGFVAAVRAWALAHGMPLKSVTVDDLVAYAQAGVRKAAKGRVLTTSGEQDAMSNTPETLAAESSEGIQFSRSGTVRTATRAATDALAATFTAPGKLSWWHKTVGTMYNLAERSPYFAPVFRAAQGFIDDVSHYANDAAEQAPKLLPKLDNWRDIWKSPISAADNTAIAKPIFEGTLMWTRDANGRPVRVADDEADSAGIVWHDSELRSMFGLNDVQVALYREFRAATNRSIDSMTRADMLRYGGKDAKPIRDAVMDARDLTAATSILRQHFRDLARAEPDRAETLTAAVQGIEDRASRGKMLMGKGYAPLSRFGRYTVDVVKDGKREYFGLFETAREANQMAARMRREFGIGSVTQGMLSQEAFKLFAGVTPETLELFGNALGLDSTGDEARDKAFQDYLRLTKSNRSAMKRMIHRQGIAGFSEDVARVLASFVYSNARQTAAGLNIGDLGEAVQAIPKEQGELKDAAFRLADYVKNPQEEAQVIRGLLFAQYLGGSIASAFVNMTQPAAVTFPWLSQFGGAKAAAAQLAKAAADMAKKRYEPDLAKALRLAEEDGTVSPQEVHQLMAQAQGSGALRAGDGTKQGEALALASNGLKRLAFAWGKVFGMAEQTNRRITFIAAYRTAVERDIDDPAKFARKAVQETQFVYSKASKMQWGRGAIGGTLMTFKTYSIAYLELLHRMATQGGPEGKRAALLALGVLMLMGGVGGLPFAGDAEDVAEALARMLGYNISVKKARQELLEDAFGRGIAGFIDKGITGLPGVPLDVSGRLGMGNLIPGTGLLQPKSSHTSDMLEIVGPAGDLTKRAFEGAGKLLQGDVAGAALQVAPTAVRNAAKGVDMASTGMYRDAKGYKVLDTDGLEAALKAIGFQPKSVAAIQEANAEAQQAKNFYNLRAQEIRAKWAQGVFENDPSKVQEARDEVAEWNRKNPDQRMVIAIPSVMKKVKEMRKSKDERIAATAPKAMRASLKEDLARVREGL